MRKPKDKKINAANFATVQLTETTKEQTVLLVYNRQDVAAIILNCIINNAKNGIEPKTDFKTILKIVDVSNGEEFETFQNDEEDITYDGEPFLG